DRGRSPGPDSACLDAASSDQADHPGSGGRDEGRSLGRTRPALAGLLRQALSIGVLDSLGGLVTRSLIARSVLPAVADRAFVQVLVEHLHGPPGLDAHL